MLSKKVMGMAVAAIGVLLCLAIWRMWHDAQYPGQTRVWTCGNDQGEFGSVNEVVVPLVEFRGKFCGQAPSELAGSNAVNFVFRRTAIGGGLPSDLQRGPVDWRIENGLESARFTVSVASAEPLRPAGYTLSIYYGRQLLSLTEITLLP
jgi:hypothetical protein